MNNEFNEVKKVLEVVHSRSSGLVCHFLERHVTQPADMPQPESQPPRQKRRTVLEELSQASHSRSTGLLDRGTEEFSDDEQVDSSGASSGSEEGQSEHPLEKRSKFCI